MQIIVIDQHLVLSTVMENESNSKGRSLTEKAIDCPSCLLPRQWSLSMEMGSAIKQKLHLPKLNLDDYDTIYNPSMFVRSQN